MTTARSMALILTLGTMTGCRAIADIFKAGVWVGVIAVVGVVLLIAGGAALFARR